MPGRLRWPLVRDLVAGHHEATVGGVLYDTRRGYPAATFGDGPGIQGAVLVLRPEAVGRAFVLLDEVEGPSYRRIEVVTATGEATAAYEWIAPLEGLVVLSSGRWPKDDERR